MAKPAPLFTGRSKAGPHRAAGYSFALAHVACSNGHIREFLRDRSVRT